MRSKVRVLPYVLLLLPLDVLVAATLAIAAFFEKKTAADGADNADLSAPSASSAATILIVNWDGRQLLEECLPSVVQAAHGHDILVVDNGSTDGSVEFIRHNFPSVHVLELDRNYGFSEGNNRGVAAVKTDVVIFLNNDMIVDPDFLRPLMTGFSDPSVFAVTSQISFQDLSRRQEETGKTRARFRDGAFYFWHDGVTPEDEQRETIPVFWAGGGSCAVSRAKFLKMGGFDRLYYPFYVEDTDISYQAWKRGWKCLLAPSSRVIHKHRGTSKTKFGSVFVDNTIRRNQYLFIWKNVTDFSMLLEHIVNLPRSHARAMINDSNATFEIRAYTRAVLRILQAVRRRIRNHSAYCLSDREVLARSHKP